MGGRALTALIERLRGVLLATAVLAAALLAAACPSAPAGEPNAQAEFTVGPILQAPADPSRWPAWRDGLGRWRERTRRELAYDDSLYRAEAFRWAASCFSCCFAMMNDLAFYDPEAGAYRDDAYVAAGERNFGGYDALVLWHAYPRIGFDDRNQFDFYRDMPGGLDGLRDLGRRLRERGVRVFIDYNPWDTGTRREGTSDVDALAALVAAIEADGIFLDTLHHGSKDLRPRLDAVRRGVVLESELDMPVREIARHHMSWAQGFKDSPVPGVLRNKWFERRHMQHQIRRWQHDHTGELHSAWMNGSGMMVWENVFGTWVGWNGRDRSILRTMVPIQRHYARVFAGEKWMPLVPTEAEDVYASRWEREALRLWTLVNRADEPRDGTLLEVRHEPGARYVDLVRGVEIEPESRDGRARLVGAIAPRGIGCFLVARPDALDEDFADFLREQRRTHARRHFSTTFPKRKETLRPVQRTRLYAPADLPEGMIAISGGEVRIEVTFRRRECGTYAAPLKRTVTLSPYAIDAVPVTNRQFAAFLEAAGYEPRHKKNFLKHWVDGRPPPGREDHPVVYVDLADARSYARWAGKRLPTEDEWQHAAQGPERWKYPWGNELDPQRCNHGQTDGTTPVRAFPKGRSPFGCWDMCGNTWEWTESERSDGRTRFCILRGGSWYKAKGSRWYADGGPQPTHRAAKFLMMWPGLDRCATIGFRCTLDMAAAPDHRMHPFQKGRGPRRQKDAPALGRRP